MTLLDKSLYKLLETEFRRLEKERDEMKQHIISLEGKVEDLELELRQLYGHAGKYEERANSYADSHQLLLQMMQKTFQPPTFAPAVQKE